MSYNFVIVKAGQIINFEHEGRIEGKVLADRSFTLYGDSITKIDDILYCSLGKPRFENGEYHVSLVYQDCYQVSVHKDGAKIYMCEDCYVDDEE